MFRLKAIVCLVVFLVLPLSGCDFGTYGERVESTGGTLPTTNVSQDSGSTSKDAGSDKKDAGSDTKFDGSDTKDAAAGSDTKDDADE